jgi:S1-C subfamily serine protease
MGINDAYLPPSTGAVAIGFSIPAATVLDIVEQLLKNGHAQHAFVGLSPGPVTPEVAQQLGVQSQTGVVVLEVVPGGPADRAGIVPGDIIVTLDGSQVADVGTFLASLRKLSPGQVVTLQLTGAGGNRVVKVTLADRPPTS